MNIFEMARKAGFDSAPNGHVYHPDTNDEHLLDKYLEAFAELVRVDEREACAKVCEEQIKTFLSPQYKTGQPLSSFGERHAAASCAKAIRARGTT